jgi:hypothetical protein
MWDGVDSFLTAKQLAIHLRKIGYFTVGFFFSKTGSICTQHPTLDVTLKVLDVNMIQGATINAPRYHPNPNKLAFAREASMQVRYTCLSISAFDQPTVDAILRRSQMFSGTPHLTYRAFPKTDKGPASLLVTMNDPELVKKMLSYGISFTLRANQLLPGGNNSILIMASVVLPPRPRPQRTDFNQTNYSIMCDNQQLIEQNKTLIDLCTRQHISNNQHPKENDETKPQVFDRSNEGQAALKRVRTEEKVQQEEDSSKDSSGVDEDEDEVLSN